MSILPAKTRSECVAPHLVSRLVADQKYSILPDGNPVRRDTVGQWIESLPASLLRVIGPDLVRKADQVQFWNMTHDED